MEQFKRIFLEQNIYNQLVRNMELFLQMEHDEDILIGNINISRMMDKNVFIYNIYTNDDKVFVMGTNNRFMYFKFNNKKKKYIVINTNKWNELNDILNYVENYLNENHSINELENI